jgi:hypothetical protein
MYEVHDTFRIRFGAAREVRALMNEGIALMKEMTELGSMSVLWNFTGPNYTFVLVSRYESLAAYEQNLSQGMAHPEWQEWYRRLVPFIEAGNREVFTVG